MEKSFTLSKLNSSPLKIGRNPKGNSSPKHHFFRGFHSLLNFRGLHTKATGGKLLLLMFLSGFFCRGIRDACLKVNEMCYLSGSRLGFC